MRRLFAAVLLVLSLTAAPAFAAPAFPALTGRVVDNADILPPQVESELTGKLAALEASTGRQLAIATVPSLQGYEIEDFGYQLGRAWGIGEAKADTGVLFLVAPSERKVRIEVGYGLEPILTDALSSVILQTAVIPRFRDGDMPGGVAAGADALVQQLSLPEDQAKARVVAASEQSGADERAGIPVVIILFVLLFVLSRIFGGRRGMGGVIPGLIIGSILNSRGGGGGWGGGGGGGWSGGGGSFGGGGSSGSW